MLQVLCMLQALQGAAADRCGLPGGSTFPGYQGAYQGTAYAEGTRMALLGEKEVNICRKDFSELLEIRLFWVAGVSPFHVPEKKDGKKGGTGGNACVTRLRVVK